MSDNKEIYSKDVIEFVTVAAEFSKFLESASVFSIRDYISKLLKLLPLLYLKTSLINKPETLLDDEYLETFVSETEYEMLRQEIAAKIGTSDSYLEIYTQDMEVSDEHLRRPRRHLPGHKELPDEIPGRQRRRDE